MKSALDPTTREEQANAEIARTRISTACRTVWIALFIVALLSVLIVQTVDDLFQYTGGARDDAVPEAARLAPLWTAARRAFESNPDAALFPRISTANRALLREMEAWETRLEDASWLTRTVLPPAQYFFTRRLNLGNEQAYCGQDGELYYRPDVDFVTGAGFLDPRRQRRRRLAAATARRPVESDPLPAVLQFHRELAAAGIHLIVMPVPVKPSLNPDGLYPAYPDALPAPQNPSFDPFVDALRRAGVDVFDCRDPLAAAPRGGFLKQDTHWSPAGMEQVAAALAEKIRRSGRLTDRPPVSYTRRQLTAANTGDIAALLRLPPSAGLYTLEKVEIMKVLTPQGFSWERSPDARVLLLGDSFSNIYSLPALNWGLSAGFAEQLSFHLQRPLDRIAFNDDGAFAARAELARRRAAGQQPLAGRKILIWEFAARELAQGDWRRIALSGD